MKNSMLINSYRDEIDGLRALAVSSVVIFHFFPKFLPSGFLGVDIFFIISGYLVTNNLIKTLFINKNKLKLFYINRIKRLFPALFVFIFITTISISFIYIRTDLEKYTDSLFASITFWSNIYFWLDGGYFGGNDQIKPLLHLWSLSVEEQFYIFFPLFLILSFFLKKKIRFKIKYFIITITFFSFILWLYLNFIGGENPAFFLLPTRAWQFGMGALISIIYIENRNFFTNIKNYYFFLSLSLILIFVAILISFNNQLQTIFVSLGTFGFLVFSYNKNNFFIKIFRLSLLKYLGKISYSVYLYHWPIASILIYYYIEKIPFLISISGIFLSVILGNISYVYIEQVFRKKVNFNYTLLILILSIILSYLSISIITKSKKNNLINMFSSEGGNHFRCDVKSFIPYGASRACILRKDTNNSKEIVILGNSHALMYGPLILNSIPTTINLKIVWINGCLPTPNINISKKCLLMANKNLETIIDDRDVDYVLISSTWYENFYINNDLVKVKNNKLIEGINNLIDKLEENKKKTYLFSPIAIPGSDITSELPRKIKFKKLNNLKINEYLSSDKKIYEYKFSKINKYFEEKLGDKYIKVYKDLCDNEKCYYGKKNILYFSDATHLSISGLNELNRTKSHIKSIFNN